MEQRRTERVTLQQPVPAVVNGEVVHVVDASMQGVRLSHSNLIPQGAKCEVAFEWDGKPIHFVGLQRWTKPHAGAATSGYQSGFEIASIDSGSNAALYTLVQSAKETLYVRHELVHGVWRKNFTTDTRQPITGFTVRKTESAHQVDLLRAAYMVGDLKMRDTIRRIAELSIAFPDWIWGRNMP
ncbi:MAG TPA: PilZ domain-containing protein [Thermoanaerobaculia bacterium]|jgi:hypothetical protein